MSETSMAYRSAVLRDRRWSDRDDYIRWFLVDTAWQDWDAPWEAKTRSLERVRANFEVAMAERLPPVRRRFEVEGPGGVHLGWTNSYFIDRDPSRCALGIDLPDAVRGGPGIGTAAFALHAAYRFHLEDRRVLYAETWSGNLLMIGMAVRCGFREHERARGGVQVRGVIHDGLTLVLERERLFKRFPELRVLPFPAAG